MKKINLSGVALLLLLLALFALRRCGGDPAAGYQTTTVTCGAITQTAIHQADASV